MGFHVNISLVWNITSASGGREIKSAELYARIRKLFIEWNRETLVSNFKFCWWSRKKTINRIVPRWTLSLLFLHYYSFFLSLSVCLSICLSLAHSLSLIHLLIHSPSHTLFHCLRVLFSFIIEVRLAKKKEKYTRWCGSTLSRTSMYAFFSAWLPDDDDEARSLPRCFVN